jgi:hypothetical protein
MRHRCPAATGPGCGYCIGAQDGKQRIPQALRPSTIPQRLWSALRDRDPPICEIFPKKQSTWNGDTHGEIMTDGRAAMQELRTILESREPLCARA